MKSAITNICEFADRILKQFNYDPKRLGYDIIEIQEMKRFIDTINTKDEFAREQIEVDIMRIVDNFRG